MSKFYFSLALVFIAVAGWGIGSKLDPGSLAMVVGICFGVMAGIPGALLLLESQRHGRTHRDDYERPPRVQVEPPKPQQAPPPRIIHNHVHYHAAPGQLQTGLQKIETVPSRRNKD